MASKRELTKDCSVIDISKIGQGGASSQICAHKDAATKEADIIAQACVHQRESISEESQTTCHTARCLLSPDSEAAECAVEGGECGIPSAIMKKLKYVSCMTPTLPCHGSCQRLACAPSVGMKSFQESSCPDCPALSLSEQRHCLAVV